MTTLMSKKRCFLSILLLSMSLIQADSCCVFWSSFTSMSTVTIDIAPNPQLLDLCSVILVTSCECSIAHSRLCVGCSNFGLICSPISFMYADAVCCKHRRCWSNCHIGIVSPLLVFLSPPCRLPLRCSFSSLLCRSNAP